MDVPDEAGRMRRILHAYVDIFYDQEPIVIGEVAFPPRRIVHVVRRRRDDGKKPEEIKWLLDQIPLTVASADFEVVNKNQRRYPSSTLRIRGSVVVVIKKIDGRRGIVTAFTRNQRGIGLLGVKSFRNLPPGRRRAPKSDPPIDHRPFGRCPQ